MPSPGQLVSLAIEKPAAGGAMIARVDGQVVLVTGAIPGERVTARVDRIGKGVVHAQTVSVDEPSPDRREPFTDLSCGGSLYAHIRYERQLQLKADVLADAFARIGRVSLPRPTAVRPSPEQGYRMRARLHVAGGRAGFFREGTHDLCDAGRTRQLLPATMAVVDRVTAGLRSLGVHEVREIEVSENIPASERAVHLTLAAGLDPHSLGALARTDGVTGLSMNESPSRASGSGGDAPARLQVAGGDPHVSDSLAVGERTIRLRRHVLSFFQGNRYLLQDLTLHVLSWVEAGGEVVDLYAGVGLFAVSIAVSRGRPVVAVEGDRAAAQDLTANARQAGGAVEVACQPVEIFAARTRVRPDTVILDPPRTGVSRAALEGVHRLAPRRIVYVSCDVATLARDSRHLIDGGYGIRQMDAFDLFPNTPHVEAVLILDRTASERT
jgi:23S rRNA (uracil1939-C5)-methyltransferase